MANVGCNQTMAVVWLCVSVALSSTTYSGFQVNLFKTCHKINEASYFLKWFQCILVISITHLQLSFHMGLCFGSFQVLLLMTTVLRLVGNHCAVPVICVVLSLIQTNRVVFIIIVKTYKLSMASYAFV